MQPKSIAFYEDQIDKLCSCLSCMDCPVYDAEANLPCYECVPNGRHDTRVRHKGRCGKVRRRAI
jgi:hypothetical protein